MNEPNESTPRTTVTVKPHGTMVVEATAELRIVDTDGNPLPLPERKNPLRISLCGCGQSRSWPVCDSSHKVCGRGTPGNPIPRPDEP